MRRVYRAQIERFGGEALEAITATYLHDWLIDAREFGDYVEVLTHWVVSGSEALSSLLNLETV